MVAITATIVGADIGVNVADLSLIGLIGLITAESLLSLQPTKAADVAIAPSGRNGILANHVRTSRRVCWLACFVI